MVKQERAVRTRKALIAAAADHFSHDGYGPASLVAISRQAGVTTGALHFHFPTKEALASAVVTAAAQRLRELLAGCEARTPSGEALRLLVDAGHELTRRLREDAVLRAGFELDGDLGCPEGIGGVRGLWCLWIQATLEQAEKTGELREGVVPAQLAAVVYACTVGLQTLGRRDPGWCSQRMLTRFWSLALPRITADRRGPDPAGS
ncbi:ScbR family autoregulator-binding transcription factor [Streptomyces rubradiris]|uniref:TetR family transcriptional regulator n=1 Tax=Streptomyces rubradiris TaxID=285531 RepID=A0ABQ3RQX1_STRRR|nr:ScbR family autoregulator-binding transcription factor [Streptomyces rubradiris]GHH24722.1 TetR family transcriptional regulator [Streptomyces rubradiris]GHI58255.1 TetR family transcriptional regulator [Streptomyces rubradiris]